MFVEEREGNAKSVDDRSRARILEEGGATEAEEVGVVVGETFVRKVCALVVDLVKHSRQFIEFINMLSASKPKRLGIVEEACFLNDHVGVGDVARLRTESATTSSTILHIWRRRICCCSVTIIISEIVPEICCCLSGVAIIIVSSKVDTKTVLITTNIIIVVVLLLNHVIIVCSDDSSWCILICCVCGSVELVERRELLSSNIAIVVVGSCCQRLRLSRRTRSKIGNRSNRWLCR